MLRSLRFLVAIGALTLLGFPAQPAHAWGKGHRLIRLWAVERLPQWQKDIVGKPHLDRLCQEYTSLQDQHASGNAPELDPYCVIPGVSLSLHDVNPAEPSFQATRWFLDKIITHLEQGQPDEAMKYLGVLCHWNEDPGSPSAHSSPISEHELKLLLPPPPDKQNLNYLYGYGGISDIGDYEIPPEPYSPRLLGAAIDEAVARIWQHQRLLKRRTAARIIPLIQDTLHGDGREADKHRAQAALDNARHIADILHTIFCLAANRIEPAQAAHWQTQSLTEWDPDTTTGHIGHPYYVTPFLVDRAMDANRRLHPLKFHTDPQPENPSATGFGMGAPYTLKFTLAPAGVFDRFTCRVGLHESAGPDGEVTFVILANGKERHRTPPLRPTSPAMDLDIPLPQDETLTLHLQTLPTNPAHSSQNLTLWTTPTLHRANK